MHNPFPRFLGVLAAGFVLAGTLGAQSAGSPAQSAGSPAQSAGSPAPLTLTQAVDLALKNNLSLRNQGLVLDIKKSLSDLSFNKFYPTVSVSGGFINLNQPQNSAVPVGTVVKPGTYGLIPLTEYTPNALNLMGNLTVQEVISPTSFVGIAQAGTDYRNSKIAWDQAVKAVTSNVKKAYFQLFVLQESIKVTEKQLVAAQERYRQVSARYQAGQAQELSLLQAQIGQDSIGPTLEGFRQNQRQYLFVFESLLGMDPDPTLTLGEAPALEIPDNLPAPEVLVDRFGSGNLDIRQAEGQLTAAQEQEALLDTSLFPNLVLQYSMDPMLNDAPGTDLFNPSNWMQKQGGFSGQVLWKLDPFLPGSTFWMNRGAQANQTAIARTNLDQARRTVKTTVSNLTDAIARGRVNLVTWDKVAQAAAKALRLTESAFQAGTETMLDVNEADISAQSAELNVLNVKQALYANLLDLQDTLNAPVDQLGK